MVRKGGNQKIGSRSTKTRKDIVEDKYDDEIDAFHKQRDIVPLDVNDESDEDDVQPVFDLKGVDDEDDEDEEDTEDDEESGNGRIAKMIRQSKYMRAKFGDVDDEMAEDDKGKDEEDKRITRGGRKRLYHVDFELQSSDDEDLKAEEEEVLRLQAEKSVSITAADAGLEDDSEEESDRELTLEEISVKGKHATSVSPVSSSVIRITQDTVKSVKIHKKEKVEKRKHQENVEVDIQSECDEMLKLRAALKGKLRSNGVFGYTVSKSDKAQKRQKLTNRKLESFDHYVDDVDNITPDKVTKLVSTKRKPKTVCGDDDLPQRDDIGERRRKFELKVLAGAGVKSKEDGKNESGTFASDDDNDIDMVDNDGESEVSEDEFYKQVKQKQEAKRAAKAEIYSRKPSSTWSLPESVDGKRVISNEMQKNRGLTRHCNKDLKNPRVKYKKKHEQKLKARTGQVRSIRKPLGPSYGGEGSGINPNISRSIRIKN